MTPAELQKDVERYHELQESMRTLFELGKVHTPQFQAFWAESEKIKNAHNGFVPTLKQIAENS